MSTILDKNKIDGIAVDEVNKKVVLAIFDHLDWEDEYNHLLMLQEKINNYLSFIESKQIYEAYSSANGLSEFVFEFYFKHEITENCIKFLRVVEKQVEELNIEILIK